MYSVALLTSGSLGSRSDSTIGKPQSSSSSDLIAWAALDFASVDELAVVVVAEFDVLNLAERLQRAVAALHLAVCDTGTDEVADPDDDQEDPKKSERLLQHDNSLFWLVRFI